MDTCWLYQVWWW